MGKSELQSIFEKEDYRCRSYSGRSMYGKECLGVTLQEGETLGQLFGKVLISIADTVEETTIYQDVAEDFETMQTDSMGLGMIVYFPGVPFVDDGVDREYSDEDAY